METFKFLATCRPDSFILFNSKLELNEYLKKSNTIWSVYKVKTSFFNDEIQKKYDDLLKEIDEEKKAQDINNWGSWQEVEEEAQCFLNIHFRGYKNNFIGKFTSLEDKKGNRIPTNYYSETPQNL